MYNWFAVKNKNFAPKGWHVPTEAEWNNLINMLGGKEVAGGKLKEMGLLHWENNATSTNQIGFTALPGGYCNEGSFNGMNGMGLWWSSSDESSMSIVATAFEIWNIYSFVKVAKDDWNKDVYLSVRCIKD